MKQPSNKKQSFSSKQIIQIVFAVALVGIAVLILAALLLFWFPQILQRPPAQVAPTLVPTPVAPTPSCIEPKIIIGNIQLPIRSIAHTDDTLIPSLPNDEEAAYWVEGTNINYIFVLNPMTGNGELSANIKSGDNITITWADCTTEKFVVSAVDAQAPISTSMFDQTHGGVTVIFQASSSIASLVVHAVRPEALVPVTPEPTNPNQIQTQIDFGETSVSENGQTFQINLTVTNSGNVVIPLTTTDLSITSESTHPIYPVSVEPALPQEIQPGDSLLLTATFPNPNDKSSVLNVLDTSIELFFILP